MQEQKLTYGEYVRAQIAATGRNATVEDKIARSLMWQRRQERAKLIRSSFKLVSG